MTTNSDNKTTVWNKIRGPLGWIVFGIIVGIMSLFILLQTVFPNAGMAVFGFRMLRISGHSMNPTLREDDLVFVSRANFDELQRGDVVTYQMPNGRLVTHRIINEDNYRVYADDVFVGFRTQGDNPNLTTAPRVMTRDGAGNTNKFVGRVRASNRPLGQIIAFITSPAGIIVMFINAAGVIAIYLIITKFRKDDEKESPETLLEQTELFDIKEAQKDSNAACLAKNQTESNNTGLSDSAMQHKAAVMLQDDTPNAQTKDDLEYSDVGSLSQAKVTAAVPDKKQAEDGVVKEAVKKSGLTPKKRAAVGKKTAAPISENIDCRDGDDIKK